MKYFHIIEHNKFGDHTTVKEFEKEAVAKQFVKQLEKFALDGEEYYIVDIRDEY